MILEVLTLAVIVFGGLTAWFTAKTGNGKAVVGLAIAAMAAMAVGVATERLRIQSMANQAHAEQFNPSASEIADLAERVRLLCEAEPLHPLCVGGGDTPE